MSAPRSKQSKLVKKFGSMADKYQKRIDNQQEIIGRLTSALMLSQGAMHSIEHEAKDVRAARKMAKDAAVAINAALEKEPEE